MTEKQVLTLKIFLSVDIEKSTDHSSIHVLLIMSCEKQPLLKEVVVTKSKPKKLLKLPGEKLSRKKREKLLKQVSFCVNNLEI